MDPTTEIITACSPSSTTSSLCSSPSFKAFTSSVNSSSVLSLADLPTLPDPEVPDEGQITKYAASIIRAEANALFSLANRLGGSDTSDECDFDFPLDGVLSRTNHDFLAVLHRLAELSAHGKAVITGVGKSGIVARKIVATFSSLGIPAVFLHPLEALHGDLGLICSCTPDMPCDALFLISHSGATAELMRLLPIVRPRVRFLAAITRDPESVLAQGCTYWLDAGTGVTSTPLRTKEKLTDEADPALPAPTSSVMTALAIGDALALTLSRLKVGWHVDGKTRRADFFRCHPGGQLGIELGREGRGLSDGITPST